jgi:hypothetical protein
LGHSCGVIGGQQRTRRDALAERAWVSVEAVSALETVALLAEALGLSAKEGALCSGST